MQDEVKVLDLTAMETPTESVAIIYFKALAGTIHIYRDGTVMLSSPAGTSMTSLRQPDADLQRKTAFLHMLTQLGATQQELHTAEEMMRTQEKRLQALPFAEAVEQVAAASHGHFQGWCQQHGMDEATLDEETFTQLIDDAITEVRRR